MLPLCSESILRVFEIYGKGSSPWVGTIQSVKCRATPRIALRRKIQLYRLDKEE